LLTERGVQLVEGVYVERVMKLSDEALNHIYAELEMALKRAEKGGFTSTEHLPNWNSRAYKLLGVT